jgi:hypothetical protein
MWGKIPKLLILFNVVALGLLVTGVFMFRSLGDAIESGKEKRAVSHTFSIAMHLEAYRADHGAYPKGFDVEALRAALEPAYSRLMPSGSLSYYSDGDNYAIISRSSAPAGYRGPTYRGSWGVTEIRNGEFIIWPGLLSEESIQRMESQLRRAHEELGTCATPPD